MALIKQMARDNAQWGSERIRGEVLKLNLHVFTRAASPLPSSRMICPKTPSDGICSEYGFASSVSIGCLMPFSCSDAGSSRYSYAEGEDARKLAEEHGISIARLHQILQFKRR
jgi:hypothetical protein